jgi:hypothetical protein
VPGAGGRLAVDVLAERLGPRRLTRRRSLNHVVQNGANGVVPGAVSRSHHESERDWEQAWDQAWAM